MIKKRLETQTLFLLIRELMSKGAKKNRPLCHPLLRDDHRRFEGFGFLWGYLGVGDDYDGIAY